jgi:LPPG:FO 2-phospho-L-lactate transferase
MLAELGHEPSAQGVARLYSDFTGTFVVDPADKSQAEAVRALNMNAIVLPTVMKTRTQKRKLARALLNL